MNIENVGNVHRKLMVLTRLHIKFSMFMCNLVFFFVGLQIIRLIL